MKRKKSRHKKAAVAFLTNISLDGYSQVTTESRQPSKLTTAASTTADPICPHPHELHGFHKTQLSDATNIPISKPNPCHQNNVSDKLKNATLTKQPDSDYHHWLQVKNHSNENGYLQVTDPNHLCAIHSLYKNVATNQDTVTSDYGLTDPKQGQGKSIFGDVSLRDVTTVKSTGSGTRPASVKCLVISCGPRQSVRSLFSVIPYSRRVSTTSSRVGHRASTPFTAANCDSPPAPSHCNGAVGSSAVHRSTSTGESLGPHLCPPTNPGKPFSQSSVPPANPDSVRHSSIVGQAIFVRPTGDEVISVAAFLRYQRCHPSSTPWTMVSGPVTNHCCCCQLPLTLSCSDLGRLATAGGGGSGPTDQRAGGLSSTTPRVSFLTCSESVAQTGVPAGPRDQVEANGRQEPLVVAGKPIHRTPRHQPCCLTAGGSLLRGRLDSTGQRGGSPSTALSSSTWSTACLEPLLHYLPNVLDDPDLLVATGKRFMQLPGYLTTLLAYIRPSEQKRNVNLEFHTRFPLVQLTLTKLRSLKADIVRTVHKLSFDLWIAAHAHVLFEKLVLKLLINKLNRKAYASAALLISAKLNDIKGPELSALLQEIEGVFRVSRRDLFHAEIEVFFSLEFFVLHPDSDILPHYLRIHRDIDVAPLVPIGCVKRNLLQLTLTSLTDAVVQARK